MSERILLRVANKEDRATVATILFRNGYRVELAKIKNGRSYEHYVCCERLPSTVVESNSGDRDDES